MHAHHRWLAAPLLLAACLALTAPAQGPAASGVRDGGEFFSAEAKKKADAILAEIKRDSKIDVLVLTVPGVPADLKARYDKEGKKDFFRNWAVELYKKEGVEGILVLISRDPKTLYVETGRKTAGKAFTANNRDTLVHVLDKELGAGNFDDALVEGVEHIQASIQLNTASGSMPAGPEKLTEEQIATLNARRAAANQGFNIWGLVCIGLVVAFGLWVVIGLVRSFSGGGRQYPPQGGYPQGGGPGYGAPGYGGPGYGAPAGGGGGFMSGLLGGMLGGAAGAWAYDSFFRGGSSGGSSYPPAGGGFGTPSAYGGDAGAGAPSDSQPGGGTGGDWGGGTGDTGGSADWGGGGGDTGGSADWGGGGDAGGGSADWGGGDTGGGGDWGGGGDGGGSSDW